MDYHCGRWKRKRTKILKRDKYLCQDCLRYGKRLDATMVHHIYTAEEYPEYEWCDWNLISLCGKSHEKMHDKINGRLTVEGERLKRVADKRRKQSPPLQKSVSAGESTEGRNSFQ